MITYKELNINIYIKDLEETHQNLIIEMGAKEYIDAKAIRVNMISEHDFYGIAC